MTIKKKVLISLFIVVLVLIISILVIQHIIKINKTIYHPDPNFRCEEPIYCKDMKMIKCASEAGETIRFTYTNGSRINSDKNNLCFGRPIENINKCMPVEWDCNNTYYRKY